MNKIEVPEGAIDLKANPEAALICPIQSSAFAFLAPAPSGHIARPGQPTVMQGGVAVPCAGEKCAWWRKDERACAILVMSNDIGNSVAAVDQVGTEVNQIMQLMTPPSTGGMLSILRGMREDLAKAQNDTAQAIILMASAIKEVRK